MKFLLRASAVIIVFHIMIYPLQLGGMVTRDKQRVRASGQGRAGKFRESSSSPPFCYMLIANSVNQCFGPFSAVCAILGSPRGPKWLNLVEILKFGQNFWIWIEILKFGQISQKFWFFFVLRFVILRFFILRSYIEYVDSVSTVATEM